MDEGDRVQQQAGRLQKSKQRLCGMRKNPAEGKWVKAVSNRDGKKERQQRNWKINETFATEGIKS